VRINGGWIKLDALGRAIVNALQAHSCMKFGQLTVKLAPMERDKIKAAVVALARHELININTSINGRASVT